MVCYLPTTIHWFSNYYCGSCSALLLLPLRYYHKPAPYGIYRWLTFVGCAGESFSLPLVGHQNDLSSKEHSACCLQKIACPAETLGGKLLHRRLYPKIVLWSNVSFQRCCPCWCHVDDDHCFLSFVVASVGLCHTTDGATSCDPVIRYGRS